MQSTTQLLIETKELKDAAMCFRALNHKLRQQILQLVHKKGRITVTDVYQKLGMEQSVASQHLAILRKEGIVNTERDRRFIFYSVNYQRLREVEWFAGQLLDIKEQVTVKSQKPGTQSRPTYEQSSALMLAVKKALEKVQP